MAKLDRHLGEDVFQDRNVAGVVLAKENTKWDYIRDGYYRTGHKTGIQKRG
jgi:hypothetical protein